MSRATLSRQDGWDKNKLVRCAPCRMRSDRWSDSALDQGVRDGHAEARLGVREALVLAVIPVALRVREDHDPVGREGRQRVLERDRRLALAGVAGRGDAVLLEALDGLGLRGLGL